MSSLPARRRAAHVRHRGGGRPRVPAGRPDAARARARCVITAGFHGDEKAGPLTLARTRARDRRLRAPSATSGCAIYPCVNPSGFEAHTRYNVTGERPNNDFLRYEIAPGVWRGELREGEAFLRVAPAGDGVPKETAALARELDALPAPAGGAGPAPGQLHPRLAVLRVRVRRSAPATGRCMARSGALVPVLRSSLVDSGHEPGSDVHADEEGFIVCHDGSITDRFHRAGVPYTAAIETTTETPCRAGRRDQPDLDPRLHRPRGAPDLNRQLDLHAGPGAGTRGEAESARSGAHALAHPDDAEVAGQVDAGERRRVEAAPVVADGQRHASGVARRCRTWMRRAAAWRRALVIDSCTTRKQAISRSGGQPSPVGRLLDVELDRHLGQLRLALEVEAQRGPSPTSSSRGGRRSTEIRRTRAISWSMRASAGGVVRWPAAPAPGRRAAAAA